MIVLSQIKYLRTFAFLEGFHQFRINFGMETAKLFFSFTILDLYVYVEL